MNQTIGERFAAFCEKHINTVIAWAVTIITLCILSFKTGQMERRIEHRDKQIASLIFHVHNRLDSLEEFVGLKAVSVDIEDSTAMLYERTVTLGPASLDYNEKHKITPKNKWGVTNNGWNQRNKAPHNIIKRMICYTLDSIPVKMTLDLRTGRVNVFADDTKMSITADSIVYNNQGLPEEYSIWKDGQLRAAFYMDGVSHLYRSTWAEFIREK